MGIESNGTIGELLRDITEGHETVFDVAADGKSLAVVRRKVQPELPKLERFESPPREHVLHTSDAVCKYVNKYGDDNTVVLLDSTTQTGRVILDELDDRQREVLTFAPQLHPMFVEWQKVIGRKVDILGFAEFAMSHRRQIVQPDGRTVALLFSQMRAEKQVSIATGQGKKSINGVMVTTTIQGQTGSEFVEIPDELTVVLPLFVGQEPRSMQIDLTVGESGDELWILCSASGVEEAKHEDFAGMVEQISDGIEHGKAVVVLGKYGVGKWDYLKA